MPRPLPSALLPSALSLRLSVALALLLALAGAAAAQPFGAWAAFDGTPGNYVRVPHSPALDPADAFTFEAWVAVDVSSDGCSPIAGKNWAVAWNVAVCRRSGGGLDLVSFLRGAASRQLGGYVGANEWNHVAVVFDGHTRKHYVNGELAATFAESGPLPGSTNDMYIGSDVGADFPPFGAINEVRLWSVARTQEQIRAAINRPITAPQPGLVAVWTDGIHDTIGPHDGTIVGSVHPWTFPAILHCGAAVNCVNEHFLVTVKARAGLPQGPNTNVGTVAVHSADSLVYWFFAPDNWELLLKVLDGCGTNNHHWVYSAATTDRFFRVEVFDVRGVQKIYFSYPGVPAPAVTDSSAFGGCP